MGMAFIKEELWARQIVALLRTKLTASRFANTNILQGQGDKWHVIAAAEVSTFDVDDDADITYTDSTDTDTELTPNLDKGFGILVKDSDIVQTSIPWQQVYVDRGAFQLRKDLDTDILLDAHVNAGADSFEDGVSTAWQFTVNTASDIPKFFAALTKQADDLDWAEENRVLTGPSGLREALNTFLGGRATAGGDMIMANGVAADMTVMGWGVNFSNNLTTAAGVTHGVATVAGDGVALKVLIDPNSIESMRAEGRFGTLVRGRVKGVHGVYRSTTVIDVNFNSTVVATS